MKLDDFTEAELEDLRGGMLQTWDVIALDVLQMVADGEGVHRDAVSMTRDEVIDVTLDADHVQAYGGHGAKWDALYWRFRELPLDEKLKLARTAFADLLYGI